MAFATTAAVYLVLGILAAALLARRVPSTNLVAAAGAFAVRTLLWPVFLPLFSEAPSSPRDAEPRIKAAEAELSEALRALAGVLGDGLGLEMRRVDAMGKAMRSAAARKVELERLLSQPENDVRRLQSELESQRASGDRSAVAEILEQRIEHLRRLETLRAHTQAELDRAIARASELATRLTLLRYDATAGSGAAATAQQLTQSIDELCEMLKEMREVG